MTEKTHMETGDPADWLFKRQRHASEHIDKCNDGYFEPKGQVHNVLEIHHALCVHACSDATFPDGITQEDIEFIYDCLAITDWNIIDADNTIGLPRKWAYVDLPDDKNWDGLPCHQVDHDLYLTAVKNDVRDKIWKQVRATKKKKACEQLKGEKLVKKFQKGSKDWKKFLKDRGKEYGGTRACLDYCIKDTKGLMDDSTWHIPFSMAPKGQVRPRVKPKGEKVKRLGLLIIDIQ